MKEEVSPDPAPTVRVEAETGSRIFPCNNYFSGHVITTPLRVEDKFKSKDFEVFLLVKKNVSENEILTVHDGARNGKRMGWCIPVNALDSAEHDFAENVHFLRYAYMAMTELFKADLANVFTEKVSDDDAYSHRFSDFLHPSTCLLVISKETLDTDSFDLDRFLPSLLSFGYTRLGDRHPDEVVWTTELKEDQRSLITLLPISSDLNDASLIVSLLHHAIVYEPRAIFSFFYAYQVIELLMEHVFMTEQAAILDEYRATVVDLSAAKDVIEKLQRVTSEKKRLGLLIEEYSSCSGQLEDLRASCTDFLQEVGRPSGEDFQSFFYGTRNFIFHQLRDMGNDREELLYMVVKDFVSFIPYLLASYRIRSFTPEDSQNAG